MVMEGADPTSLIFLPAIILVIVATFGAAMSSQTMDDLKKLPAWFKMAAMPAKVPPATQPLDHAVSALTNVPAWFGMAVRPAKVPPSTEQIQTLVSRAEKARKEGLLALEAQGKALEDSLLRPRARRRRD